MMIVTTTFVMISTMMMTTTTRIMIITTTLMAMTTTTMTMTTGAYDYHGDNGVVIMDANVVTLRMSSELTLDCSFEAAEGAAVSVGQQWSKDGQQLTSNDNSPTSKYLISRNSTTLSSSLRIRNTGGRLPFRPSVYFYG